MGGEGRSWSRRNSKEEGMVVLPLTLCRLLQVAAAACAGAASAVINTPAELLVVQQQVVASQILPYGHCCCW